MCVGGGSRVQTFRSHNETLFNEPCRWRGADWGVPQVGGGQHTLSPHQWSQTAITAMMLPSTSHFTHSLPAPSSHTVNLLGNLPLPCLDVLLLPKVQQGSVEYMGVNMDAVNVLVEFMEKRLDRVRKQSLWVPWPGVWLRGGQRGRCGFVIWIFKDCRAFFGDSNVLVVSSMSFGQGHKLKETLLPSLNLLTESSRVHRETRKFLRSKVRTETRQIKTTTKVLFTCVGACLRVGAAPTAWCQEQTWSGQCSEEQTGSPDDTHWHRCEELRRWVSVCSLQRKRWEFSLSDNLRFVDPSGFPYWANIHRSEMWINMSYSSFSHLLFTIIIIQMLVLLALLLTFIIPWSLLFIVRKKKPFTSLSCHWIFLICVFWPCWNLCIFCPVSRFIKYTGYGNAAGLLVARGLLSGGKDCGIYSDDEESETEEYKEAKAQSVAH